MIFEGFVFLPFLSFPQVPVIFLLLLLFLRLDQVLPDGHEKHVALS